MMTDIPIPPTWCLTGGSANHSLSLLSLTCQTIMYSNRSCAASLRAHISAKSKSQAAFDAMIRSYSTIHIK